MSNKTAIEIEVDSTSPIISTSPTSSITSIKSTKSMPKTLPTNVMPSREKVGQKWGSTYDRSHER
jgi:hypothetical protein